MGVLSTLLNDAASANVDARRRYLEILKREVNGTSKKEDLDALRVDMRTLGKSESDVQADVKIVNLFSHYVTVINSAKGVRSANQKHAAAVTASYEKLQQELSEAHARHNQIVMASNESGATTSRAIDAINRVNELIRKNPQLLVEEAEISDSAIE